MKKKHLNLERKLMLHKEKISSLNQEQQGLIAGGATITLFCCGTLTCPVNSAPCDCIETIGCPTERNCPVTNDPANTNCQGTISAPVCCVPGSGTPACN